MFETLYRGITDICHVGVYYKYCYVNLKATEQKKGKLNPHSLPWDQMMAGEKTLFLKVGSDFGFGWRRKEVEG